MNAKAHQTFAYQRMCSSRLIPVASLMILFAGLPAQERRIGRVIRLENAALRVRLVVNASELKIRELRGEQTRHSVPVSVHIAGQAELIDEDSIVIAGLDKAAAGIVQLLSKSESEGWEVTSTYTDPEADFLGIAFSRESKQLFLLDGIGAQIFTAPYESGRPLPMSWAPLVGREQVSVLAYALLYQLRASTSPVGDYELHVETFRSRGVPHREGRSTIIASHAGNLIIENHLPDGLNANLQEDGLAVGQSSVQIHGPPNKLVELVADVDGEQAVIVRGTTSTEGLATLTIPSPGLSWGPVYGARSVGGSWQAPFYAAQDLHGQSEFIDDVSEIRDLDGSMAVGAYIGNDRFSVSIRLDHLGEGTPVAESYDAVLHVGGAEDVVDVNGKQLLLSPEVRIFKTDVEIYDINKPGFGTLTLPMPEDAAMIGDRPYFQWLVYTKRGIKVSNIAGVAIRAEAFVAPGQEIRGAKRDGEAREPVKAPSDSRSMNERLRNWMSKLGGKELTRVEIEQVRTLLR